MTTHIPQKVPEHFSRVDIGAYMRELRLHYGLSEQDVSERLHIRIKYIIAIEAAQFELMPGKAYARGYVHTYAEFLGLDADQIVERCFGGEMAREVQEHSIPESSNWYRRNRHYGGILAVLVLLGGLVYFASGSERAGNGTTAAVTDSVPSVPEEYLASIRNQLMPSTENYNCLGEETPLGCFFAQRLTREWAQDPTEPDMAPAPASAYPDKVEEKAEEPVPAPAPKEAPKPEAKPAAKKPAVVYHPPAPAAAPVETPTAEQKLPDTAPLSEPEPAPADGGDQ